MDKPVTFNTILPDVRAISRKDLYRHISARASAYTGLDRDYLLDRILDRERAAPSGVGEGVAIAHLKRYCSPFSPS